ncbi:MAG: MerR family transcriptional regulator [bacterium]
MRIGKFASKFKVTRDTVRHYLDLGLLNPQKKGGQYFFGEEDLADMEMILGFKGLGFSLAEILKLMSCKRLTGVNSEEYRTLYLSLLQEKKNSIDKEVQRYLEMRAKIKGIIDLSSNRAKKGGKTLGFPIAALSILACPLCQGRLNISDGKIKANMILKACIHCACGYSALIEDGIYMDPKSVRKRTLPDGRKWPTRKEFLALVSPQYINMRYKAVDTMIEMMQEEMDNPGYILALDPCVCLFLMHYIKYLPADATYILNEVDPEKVGAAKKEIESNYDHDNFAFFCCDIDRLPIARKTLDIVIDYFMTKRHAREKDSFVIAEVLPLLREQGLVVGAYPHFKGSSKKAFSLPANLRKYYDLEELQAMYGELAVEEKEGIDLGAVLVDNPYEPELLDKEVHFHVLAGRVATVSAQKPVQLVKEALA